MLLVAALLLACACGASFQHLSVARGGALTYSASVGAADCAISWQGARGVWKLGDFSTSCHNATLFDGAIAFLSQTPPSRYYSWRNNSEWALLTVDGATYDTRAVTNTSWDQLLRDGIGNVEFLLDNLYWPNPDTSVFGADRVSRMALRHGLVDGLLELHSNGTGFWTPTGGKRLIGDVEAAWPDAVAAYAASSFYAIESFPIQNPAADTWVAVSYLPALTQQVSWSTVLGQNPIRLRSFAMSLVAARSTIKWVDEGTPSWLANNARVAAIVCASVFGVVVLIGIILLAIKCKKPPPRKPSSVEQMTDATMLYMDNDEEQDYD
jgi:hypothetical protein